MPIRLLLAALILIAFGVRVYRLEAQPLWTDEGLSLYRARLDLPGILSNEIVVRGVVTKDTTPPFYFLLLHFLRAGAGESVFALRMLGVMAGVLMVPLLFLLGQRLFSKQAGLATAFLGALSPFHVWYSQDARTYSLLIALSLISVYALLRMRDHLASRSQRVMWVGAWVLAGVTMLYTHYTGFLVLAFEGVVLIVDSVLRSRRRWLLAVGILASLPTIPLVQYAVWRTQHVSEYGVAFRPLDRIFQELISAFSLGLSETLVHPWWAILPFLALAILGAFWVRDRQWRPSLFLLAYFLVPVLIFFVITLFKPLYTGPRHLIIVLPAFLLLMGQGLALLWERQKFLFAMAALWVTAGMIIWLNTQFTDIRFVKDDIRSAAAYITENARADDIVILHDAIIGFVFDYYYEGAAPWTVIPEYTQNDQNTALMEFQEAAETHRRTWFLYWPPPRAAFPPDLLPNWADANLLKYDQVVFPFMWLPMGVAVYGPRYPAVSTPPDDAVPIYREWETGLQLAAVSLPTSPSLAGEKISFHLYWLAGPDNQPDYHLQFRLIDPQGQEWAGWDGPIFKFLPTRAWPKGQFMVQEVEFRLPPDLPPIEYGVQVRIADEKTGHTFVLTGKGDQERDAALLLGTIRVARCTDPTKFYAKEMGTPTRVRFVPDLELIAYRLPQSPTRPGYALPVELHWRATRTLQSDYRLRVWLAGQWGQRWGEMETTLSAIDFPTFLWQQGDRAWGRLKFRLPREIPSGDYDLCLQVFDVAVGEALGVVGAGPWPTNFVTLGRVRVESWPFVTETPPMVHETNALVGGAARLEGYNLSASRLTPGPLTLTLYWRAVETFDRSYHVFVHLVSAHEVIVSQSDGVPVNWTRPTDSWRRGEVIVDEHHLTIGEQIPPGVYSLYVGLYDPKSKVLERLKVVLDGIERVDGRVPLGTIEVVGPP
ncbi:MAG: glycosyltransferase family 39 protein [Chloroflexi bacterium]|nr:glycosyltransferase family 39 protein [Chloroflexota bacterium]